MLQKSRHCLEFIYSNFPDVVILSPLSSLLISPSLARASFMDLPMSLMVLNTREGWEVTAKVTLSLLKIRRYQVQPARTLD